MTRSRDAATVIIVMAMGLLIATVFSADSLAEIDARLPVWLYGMCLVATMAATMPWGTLPGRRGRATRGMFHLAVLLLAAILSGVIWKGNSDLSVNKLWFGTPIATGLFLYGLWSIGLLFMVIWSWQFSDGIYGPEEHDRVQQLKQVPIDEAAGPDHHQRES